LPQGLTKSGSSMLAFKADFLEELFKFKRNDHNATKKIFELTLSSQALQEKVQKLQ
jgi:hypothetical protein